MSHDTNITEERLKELFGYKNRATLVRHMKNCHIPYYIGQGGRIWTTQAALDSPLLGKKNDQPEIDFAA